MQNKRPSIYLSNHLEQLLTEVQGAHSNKTSTVINSLLLRYSAVVERNTPEFGIDQWVLLVNVLRDYSTKDISKAVEGLPGAISDYMEFNYHGCENDFPENGE